LPDAQPTTTKPTNLEIDMRRSHTLVGSIALAFAAAGCVNRSLGTTPAIPAGDATSVARAELRNLQGALVGTATLQQTPNGVLVTADIANLPAGTHAIHFHTVGSCEPPFASAGGHFNPSSRQHGFRNDQGPHAGDLPNIHVPTTGATRVDHLSRDVSLRTTDGGLFDGDGSALVIHALADDYRTDPSGASGDRIACGVVTR
jgi:Cu-Zn family superoxide dismutase